MIPEQPLAKRGLGLRTTMALTTATLLVALAAGLGSVVSTHVLGEVTAKVGEAMARDAVQLANKMDAEVDLRLKHLSLLAKVPDITAPDRAQEMLDEVMTRDRNVAWAGFVDSGGRVLAAAGGALVGSDLSAAGFMRATASGVAVSCSEAGTVGASRPRARLVELAVPVRAEGKVVGKLAARVGLDWLAEDAAGQAVGKPSEIYVACPDGVALVGSSDFGEGASRMFFAGTPASGHDVHTWIDGQEYLVGYAKARIAGGLGDETWFVALRQPTDELQTVANAMQRAMTFWGLVAAAVLCSIGWVLASHITKPLRQIANAADRIRNKEPGVEIPVLRGITEIESLSVSLHNLVESLTDHKARLAHMEELAARDKLTGLPNRRAFELHSRGCAEHATDGCSLLFVDLDDFKPVNDTLGHAAGDEVLRVLAARLRECIRDDDMAARIGGDEFALLLCGADRQMAADVAARIVAAVNGPIRVGDAEARVGCSVGIATWPGDGKTVEDALARADQALYAAKRSGKNSVVCFDPEKC